MDISKKLGEEIRLLRTEALNLTQKELSEQLGVSVVYLSYLEQGKKSPSVKLLTKLFNLTGQKNITPKLKELLTDVKKEKKNRTFNNAPTNVIYRLEEQGVYSYNQLTRLLKKEPSNLSLIYGMLSLLLQEGNIQDAKNHLLQSLLQIENSEERKWLEASYYELEENYPFAIQLMMDSMKEFDIKNKVLDEEKKKIKAQFIFQLAAIYFKYGQNLYYNDNKKDAVRYFQLSLESHEELKNIYHDPFYQMDYAGTFFWLALLGISSEEYWKRYITEVKTALILNLKEVIRNFPDNSWKSLYSKPYIISTISFLIRAYAEYARLMVNPAEKKELLNEAELLLAQYTPVEINTRDYAFYRYYFNQACYHSIKAEILFLIGEDGGPELENCNKVLQVITQNLPHEKFRQFGKELESSNGLSFFKSERNKEFISLTKKIKKFSDLKS